MSRPTTDAPRGAALALTALFWVPVALSAIAIVLWPPHTVDGPAHLLGASVLADLINPSDPFEGISEFGGYGDYYRIDLFPTPNLAGTLLIGGLVDLTSLRVAETVVLLLAALGTPLALRYAIRAVRPDAAWLAIAGLPLCFGYLYFYGFYNYCLAVALALICVGLALRAAPTWPRGPTLTLAAALTLTWLTHFVPFAAAAVFLGALTITGPRTPRSWLAPAVTLLPAAGLTVAYLLRTDSGDGPTWSGPLGRLAGMVSLHTPVTTFDRAEAVIAAPLALALLALGLRAVRVGGDAAPGPALAAAAMAALVLVTPARFGIDFGLIDERLAVFPVLFALVWLAARPPAPRVALAAASAFVLVAAALAVARVDDLRRYDRLADEYATAAALIEPGSVLVALRFHTYGPDAGRNAAWDPTRHLSSGLAARTGSIDIGHYEAVLDYFPTRFRADADLRRVLDPDLRGLAAVPPRVDLAALLAALRTPAPAAERPPRPLAPAAIRPGLGTDRPFYVLLVGASDATGEAAAALTATRAQLVDDYERVGATAPRGLVEVWRSR